MELEIRPEPPADHEAAIRQALASADERPQAYESVWRLAGMLENVESEVAEPVRSGRSSDGASRA